MSRPLPVRPVSAPFSRLFALRFFPPHPHRRRVQPSRLSEHFGQRSSLLQHACLYHEHASAQPAARPAGGSLLRARGCVFLSFFAVFSPSSEKKEESALWPGNDVCNGHPGFGHMTTPDSFHDNVLTALEFLDQQRLPAGSHVVFVGLEHGLMWDVMADKVHPSVGTTYAALWSFIGCLEVRSCCPHSFLFFLSCSPTEQHHSLLRFPRAGDG